MSHATSANPAAPTHSGIAHVVSPAILIGIFLLLIALTGATLAATWFNFGDWNLAIAMGIATLKAALVALFFMHLLYDQPLNALVFITALVFLGVFTSLTLMDTLQYAPNIEGW